MYVIGHRLVTPTLEAGPLAGVTRALVLEWCAGELDVVERDAPIEVLQEADEVILVGTTRDVQGISHVDDRELRRTRTHDAQGSGDLGTRVGQGHRSMRQPDSNPRCHGLRFLTHPGDWRSGSALRSHRRGHWFEPSIAHQESPPIGGLFLWLASGRAIHVPPVRWVSSNPMS